MRKSPAPARSDQAPKGKRGRRRGVRYGSTPASRRASRTNAWKHGRYACAVTLIDVRRAELERVIPGGADVLDAYLDAFENGNMAALDPIHVRGMVETELLRREAIDAIEKRGVLLDEELIDSEGRIIGTRPKAHPLLGAVLELSRNLGMTAADQMLTRKGQAAWAANSAVAAALARDEALIAADKSDFPPPAPLDG